MTDTFTKIAQDLEEDGSGGIASELRKAGEVERDGIVTAIMRGKMAEADYRTATGIVRGLDFFLKYAERKAEQTKKELRAEAQTEEEI